MSWIFHIQHRLCFVLFVSSNSIIRRHQFQGYQIEKKKGKRHSYNKHREMDSPQFQSWRYFKVNTCSSSIGLILKTKQCECVYETLHSDLAQSWEIKKKKKKVSLIISTAILEIYGTGSNHVLHKAEWEESGLKADCMCGGVREWRSHENNSLC